MDEMQRHASISVESAARLAILVATVAASACSRAAERPYRHVILISLDTTRADQLGCYGNDGVRTPNIDRLAKEGVLFREVMAAAPTTLASHTSLMTGVYPHTHGVVRNGFDVAPENEMLAEILAREGFETAAILGSSALAGRFGFEQGFEAYDEDFDIGQTLTKYDQYQRRAASVTDAAIGFVNGCDADNLFLFVHYFDPHTPYDPPEPFGAEFARPGGPREAGPAELERVVREHQQRTTAKAIGVTGAIQAGMSADLIRKADGRSLPADLDLEALYRAEVSYVDRELGRLLDTLRERGFLESAIIVVTADHGETFAEHGDYWNHGLWVYQTTVHVPLVVWCSPARPPAAIDAAVSNVDVAPTVLAMLGIEAPRGLDGMNLAPLLEGDPFERGPVFSEATLPPHLEQAGRWGNELKPKCVRVGPWKYIRAPYLDLEELYDLSRDPGERHDLLRDGAASGEARSKADELRGELERWTASARPLQSRPVRLTPKEWEERQKLLQGLGYPGVGEEPASNDDHADPDAPAHPNGAAGSK